MTYFWAKFIKMSERAMHTLAEDTNNDSNDESLRNLQAVIMSKPIPHMKAPQKEMKKQQYVSKSEAIHSFWHAPQHSISWK